MQITFVGISENIDSINNLIDITIYSILKYFDINNIDKIYLIVKENFIEYTLEKLKIITNDKTINLFLNITGNIIIIIVLVGFLIVVCI